MGEESSGENGDLPSCRAVIWLSLSLHFYLSIDRPKDLWSRPERCRPDFLPSWRIQWYERRCARKEMLYATCGMSTSKYLERSRWLATDGWSVEIIDQTKLPHKVSVAHLVSVEDAARAAELVEEDVAANRAIGEHGLHIFRSLLESKKPGEPLQILTHCNAGRLATIDWLFPNGSDDKR